MADNEITTEGGPARIRSQGQMMTDGDLLTITDALISDAYDFVNGRIAEERADSLKRYNHEPLGNEKEGFSKVLSNDTLSTIEWLKPALMKVFMGGDKVLDIQGHGEEDTEKAETAEEWVQYVVTRMNPGFMLFLTWINDALLQKVGYVKCYWSEETEIREEVFDELTKDELETLEAMDNYETTYVEEVTIIEPALTGVDEKTGQEIWEEVEVLRYDVRANRTIERNDIIIDACPPEEVLTLEDTKDTSAKGGRFWCHRSQKTLSEVREMGYDIPDTVSESPIDAEGDSNSEEAEARRYDAGGEWTHISEDDEVAYIDPSVKLVWFYEMYVLVDYDGDGIAEWMKIHRVTNKILSKDRVKRPIFHSLCPVPMSHRHVGHSIADLVKETEDIKTSLKRQILNHLYFTNNPRAEIAGNGMNEHTINDWLNNRPNGAVRVKIPGTVNPLFPPPLNPAVFSFLEYAEQEKEADTGVARYNQGLSPDTLNKTASGIISLMNASSQRIELIARIFAETGVKSLFEHILELTVEYPDYVGDRMIRLTNGERKVITAEDVDGKFDLVVNAGVGVNKDQVVQHVMNLLMVYREMIAMGAGPEAEKRMVTWDNLYNAVREMIRGMGFKNTTDFISDPTKPPKDGEMPQPKTPPPPPPEVIRAQMDAQQKEEDRKLKREELAEERRQHMEEMKVKREELRVRELEAGSRIAKDAFQAVR